MNPAKPFQVLINSRVWCRPQRQRILWVALLAMADREGRVLAAAQTIARAAGIRRDLAKPLLAALCAALPDEIGTIPGGWLVRRFRFYEARGSLDDKRERGAARQRKWLAKRLQRTIAPPHWVAGQEPRAEAMVGGQLPVTRWPGPTDAHRRAAKKSGLDCDEQARRMRIYYADQFPGASWDTTFSAWLRRVAR